MQVKQSSHPSLSLSLFAGGAAHFIETSLLGHHIDRLMVQQQAFLHIRTIRESFLSVYRDGGWRGFYKGYKWSVVSSGIRGSAGWAFLNQTHHMISQSFPDKEGSVCFNVGVAFGAAISETSLFLCPSERLKVLEMTAFTPLELVKMIRSGGRSFIYRGWSVMVLQKSLSWMTYLTFYQKAQKKKEPLSLSEKFSLGWGTGSLIALFSTPLDLIKTQKQMNRIGPAPSNTEIIRSVYQDHGIKGCFRGLSLRIIRTGWSGALITLILDGMNAFPKGMKV